MRNVSANIEPILVSRRDAARVLSLSIRTIEGLIARKELIARKVGRRTLLPYSALLDFALRDHPGRTAAYEETQ